MATNVKWEGEEIPKTLYFKDIELNGGFRIVSPYSKGAVYQKTRLSDSLINKLGGTILLDDDAYCQREVATGIDFPPTRSPVEAVDLEISVAAPKPSIYE